MSHKVVILYFHLTYFHVSNNVLFFHTVLSIYGAILLTLSIKSLSVTWHGNVCELARSYGIDLNHTNCSKTQIRHVIRSFFVRKWQESLTNTNKNPILRTYVRFKTNFGIESYLVDVINPQYRAAISKLRTSSHALEAGRGRHTKPKTPLWERLCANCHVLEDEQHFVMECTRYETQKRVLFNNIITSYPEFSNGNVNDASVLLLQTTDKNSNICKIRIRRRSNKNISCGCTKRIGHSLVYSAHTWQNCHHFSRRQF